MSILGTTNVSHCSRTALVDYVDGKAIIYDGEGKWYTVNLGSPEGERLKEITPTRINFFFRGGPSFLYIDPGEYPFADFIKSMEEFGVRFFSCVNMICIVLDAEMSKETNLLASGGWDESIGPPDEEVQKALRKFMAQWDLSPLKAQIGELPDGNLKKFLQESLVQVPA